MKFCKVCQNMLYISLSDESEEKTLKMICRNCNYSETSDETINRPVFETNLHDDMINYNRHKSPDVKYDATMPRLNSIVCTNSKCVKKHDQVNDVMYMKYDPIDMKYMYFCTYCDHFWRASTR